MGTRSCHRPHRLALLHSPVTGSPLAAHKDARYCISTARMVIDMKRVSILVLVVLMGGSAVYGGVGASSDAVAADLNGGGTVGSKTAPAARNSSEASGELSAVLFGEGPSASLRLSHEMAETGVVITLNASDSADPSIVLYEWDLDGDGSYDATTEGPTFAHAFAENGIYGIQVRVTDDLGATGESGIVELVVLNRTPVARFTVAGALRTDVATYGFHDDSTDLDGEIVRWSWDLGDGAVSDDPNPIHAYGDNGTYSVTLVVTDEDGDASAPVARTLVVANTEPIAAFALGADSIDVGESASFADESVDPSPDGSIVHVAWDFGDGSYQAGGPSADGVYVHTYTTAGTYTVTLYVIDDDGGMSSVRQIISVT